LDIFRFGTAMMRFLCAIECRRTADENTEC